jgi:hypothetical protein
MTSNTGYKDFAEYIEKIKIYIKSLKNAVWRIPISHRPTNIRPEISPGGITFEFG